MSVYYLDASALVKRYVAEPGSSWLRSLLSSSQVQLAFTSRMTIIEVISAFLSTEALPPLIFLSADDRLIDVASAEGLATDDPNKHI